MIVALIASLVVVGVVVWPRWRRHRGADIMSMSEAWMKDHVYRTGSTQPLE